jgi:hypothetical protein
MRRIVLAAALGLILAGPAPLVFAGPGRSWSTSLDTIVGIGDTRYLMELPGNPGISSELIFPLNTLLEGVSFRRERTGGRIEGGRDWNFEASLAVNLLAPFGVMKDYDWDMHPGYPKTIFSYTESDARLVWFLASAAWKPVLSSGGWGNLRAVLGYRLQYVYQEALGYVGWQYQDLDDPPDGQPDLLRLVSFPDDTVVLTYWVLWNVPTAGFSVTLTPAPGLSIVMGVGLAVPIVTDQDDHLLRNKLSTAAGLGIGGYAELAVHYSWGTPGARLQPFLSLAMDLMAQKANTLQTQTWYGDDPVSTKYVEQPGDYISGIDHQISTRQFSVVLAFGVKY